MDMDKEVPEPGPSSSTEPHRMRITSGGSIQSYVKFAISFLQANPRRPLVLNTAPPSDAITSQSNAKPKPEPRSTLHSSTLNTPRLISVVEIIKREYLELLIKAGKGGRGKHRATGIWQYTETGLVPETALPAIANSEEGAGDVEDSIEKRVSELARVLEGNTRPKMTHRPYLQITLSTRPLGLESQKNVTCQYSLLPRRKSKQSGQEVTSTAAGQISKKADAKAGTTPKKAGSVNKRQTRKRSKDRPEKPPVAASADSAVGGKRKQAPSASSQDTSKPKKTRKEIKM